LFKKYIKSLSLFPDKEAYFLVFNFTFSVSLIIGCLIKEPLYPNSILYLGCFLFASVPEYFFNKK
jgi:hypothetical protein